MKIVLKLTYEEINSQVGPVILADAVVRETEINFEAQTDDVTKEAFDRIIKFNTPERKIIRYEILVKLAEGAFHDGWGADKMIEESVNRSFAQIMSQDRK